VRLYLLTRYAGAGGLHLDKIDNRSARIKVGIVAQRWTPMNRRKRLFYMEEAAEFWSQDAIPLALEKFSW